MASSARIDELKKKFDENPRRYFAPLANEFRKGGDLDQAILICEEFLPQQPGHMSGHIVYGQALFEHGRLDDARTVFETALSLDPENLIALRHLGDIAGRQGDSSAARRWYERVLEADPRNEEIQALITSVDEGKASTPAPASRAPTEPVESNSWQSAPPALEDAARTHSAPRDEPDLIDLDLTAPDEVPVASHHASTSDQSFGSQSSEAREEPPFDALSLDGIVPMPESAERMPEVESRAAGFEATEFSAPESPVEQTAGLQSAFEDETGVYGAAVSPIEGLDAPLHEDAPRHAEPWSELPALEEDEGLVLPPHGDPVVATANAPEVRDTQSNLAALDDEFDVPLVPSWSGAPGTSSAQVVENESAAAKLEDLEFDVPDDSAQRTDDSAQRSPEAPSAESALPTELPPEVIAAEAELIDAGMSMEQSRSDEWADEREHESALVGSELTFLDTEESSRVEEPVHLAAEESVAPEEPEPEERHAHEPVESAEPEPAAHRPFVTETMAELYLKQGFRDQALSVYEQLSAANLGDSRLADKVASLRADAEAPSTVDARPTVRDFFARLARRRPEGRAVAYAPPDDDDFAPAPAEAAHVGAQSAPAVTDVAPAQTEAAASAAARGTSQPSGGTIDALFGNQPIGTSEDTAASALAQAFGAGSAAPQITGNPARQASGELSLDSVFRDGASRGPRASQGFSFDQFFSQNTEGEQTSDGRTSQEVPMPGEPSEKSAEDIEQFNSWLQGLKNR